MRGTSRVGLSLAILLAACGGASPHDAARPTSGTARAERRAYDGAPPTVPHADPGAACSACHDADGQAVGEAFAPASPHVGTVRAGGTQRCRQCHVFVTTDEMFVESRFVGLPQTLGHAPRATPGAPPVIPHRLLMRENCAACHTGPSARPEIRSSHPERWRCRQCHVPMTTHATFPSDPGGTATGGEGGRP